MKTEATATEVPRPVTRRARRRSWNEQPVRVWVVMTAVVLIVAGYFTVQRVRVALDERDLIARGTLVNAKVIELVGSRAETASRETAVPVTLQYVGPKGQPQQWTGTLPVAGGTVSRGDVIPIRVDPGVPDRWTARRRERPWTQELFVTLLLLPPLLILAAITWWRRRGVLRTWRRGTATRAAVVGVKQTALAPASKLVRYTVAGDKRVHSLLRPNRLGPVGDGDELELVADPSNAGRAVIASLYAQP